MRAAPSWGWPTDRPDRGPLNNAASCGDSTGVGGAPLRPPHAGSADTVDLDPSGDGALHPHRAPHPHTGSREPPPARSHRSPRHQMGDLGVLTPLRRTELLTRNATRRGNAARMMRPCGGWRSAHDDGPDARPQGDMRRPAAASSAVVGQSNVRATAATGMAYSNWISGAEGRIRTHTGHEAQRFLSSGPVIARHPCGSLQNLVLDSRSA